MRQNRTVIIAILSFLIVLGIAGSLVIYNWKIKRKETTDNAIKTENESSAQQETSLQEADLTAQLADTIDDLAQKGNTDCFTYEELPDVTLRITGYSEEKNIQNPYQVVIPSTIDGKQVSTLGRECLGMPYAGTDGF